MESQDNLNIAFIDDTYNSFCSDLESSGHSANGTLDGHGPRCSTPIREMDIGKLEFTREFDLTYVIEGADVDAAADGLSKIQIENNATEPK